VKSMAWKESTRDRVGRLLFSRRGIARCFVWQAERRDCWVWEVDLNTATSPSFVGFVNTEEQAKGAAEDCVASIANELLGVESK
jgi:hypothetical protein